MTRDGHSRWVGVGPVGWALVWAGAAATPVGSAAGVDACPVPAAERSRHPRNILARGEQPWSLKPLVANPTPPPRAVLPPRGSVERQRLVHRLTFLATGLPPRTDDVEAFVSDASTRALEKVVTRLQAAPAAGERLAQWWLGMVGYFDQWTATAPNPPQPVLAWRYRDWLIESFEGPGRLSHLVRLHLTGDTLPGPQPGAPNPAGLTATTWFLFGPPPRGDAPGANATLAVHQADRTARIFLGASLSCARCHDHPALPMRVEEYASWLSIFAHHHSLVPGPDGSAALPEVPTVSARRLAQRSRELARIADLEKTLAARHREFATAAAAEFLPQTAEYVRAAWAWHRQPRMTIEEFCAERGLLPAPLARWLGALGLAESFPPGSSQPWWPVWRDARASNDPAHIAQAARQIEAAHVADETSPFFDLSTGALRLLTLDQQTQLTNLEKQTAALRQKLTNDHPVHAIAQGILPGTPAPAAPPRLPELLTGAPPVDLVPPTSGRLALAAWFDGPGRPLLARLVAHRLWTATGHPAIVATDLDWWRTDPPADAGRLDALASTLDSGSASLASLLKAILLSAPQGDPLTLTDADRRDAVLFLSGQLNPVRHGPPDSSPTSRRRSLYRVWTEPSKPPPLLGSFLETQARALVALAAESAGPSPAAQTTWLTHRLLQRPPTDAERSELGDAPESAALVAFCLTLFQSDEFRVLP